ncbi:MAG TPA: glycosyltransferase [Candidatus Saccharimonadales bacterium]|nr:glycosyltransferase [Candidatus Saccharimonadales bacterium]
MISDHADPLAKIGTKDAGGQNVYVMNVATLLAKLGVIVDVYTRWDRASKQEVVTVQPGFRVIRVKAGPKGAMPRDDFLHVTDEFTRRVSQRIERESLTYHVIFSHYWFSGVIGLALARAYSLPLTHVYHSIGRMRREALEHEHALSHDCNAFFAVRDAWERRIAHESTTVISTSPNERDDIVRLFDIPADKIQVIPVGVDTAVFRPYPARNVRKRLGLPADGPLVLYAGRLEWRKGIGTLITAMAELIKRWPTATLCIIGGGSSTASQAMDADERKRLEEIITSLRLQDHVHFLGARPQTVIPAYYAAADVCAVPSYYEPFGIVPLESMACGTPVVASRTGGLQYTVEDGVSGHHVEPRSHADLAQKLATVISRGKITYTEAARHRVLRHFAWPRIGRAIAAHLALLGKTTPPSPPLPTAFLPKLRRTQLQ